MELVTLFKQNFKKLFKKQKYVKLVLILFLALYSALAAPALPNVVINFFDSMVGKLIFLFLIGYVASRDVQVALMVAVAFVITLHVANKRITENYINNILENYENKEDESAETVDPPKNCSLLGDAVRNTCKGQAIGPPGPAICDFVKEHASECKACDVEEKDTDSTKEDSDEEGPEHFTVCPSNEADSILAPISF